MNLSILVVLSLWPLIQGGFILSRWASMDGASELIWYGASLISVGIGVGLFAGRYFDFPYFIAVTLANSAIILSISLLLNGIISSELLTPRFEYWYVPVVIWATATQMEFMKDNMEARVLLSSGLILITSLSATALLLRGGIVLPSRKIGLWMYIVLVIATLIKIVFSTEISADLMTNQMNSPAHMLHYMLLMFCMSMIYFYAYVRYGGIKTSNVFMAQIWKELHKDTAIEKHQDDRADSCLWSLRLDPLAYGGALTDDRLTEAATALADVIRQHCPSVHAVMRAGSDRIIWLSGPPTQSGLLTAGLMGIAQNGCLSDLQMTLGVSEIRGRKLFSVAAEADRRGILLGKGGARTSLRISLGS